MDAARTRGFRLERDVEAPAETVWLALVEMLDRTAVEGETRPSEVGGETRFALDNWQLVERTMVSEPPVTRVYHVVEGAPVSRYEGTSTIVTVNDGCRITWTVEASPAPGREDDFDAFIQRAELAVTRGIDAVVRGSSS